MYSVSDDILVDRSYTMSRFSARIFLFFSTQTVDESRIIFMIAHTNCFLDSVLTHLSFLLHLCLIFCQLVYSFWLHLPQNGITYNDKHPYWMKIFHFPTKGIYSHRERSSDEIENNKQHFSHLHKSQTPEQRLKLTCLE